MVFSYIEEYDKYVKIASFRGVDIQNAEEFVNSFERENWPDVWVQFFNADLVATWEHLYFAVLNALLAFRNKCNISKDLAIETMVYASAQRQIRKAIALLGVKESTPNVAVVIIGHKTDSIQKAYVTIKNRVASAEDDTVLELTQEKTQNLSEAFGITKRELETVSPGENNQHSVVSLIIERMALMQTQL
jgi:tRNA threonylcarbamoyladenosine modification (KEOPS) complex Cgi121 subunit